MARFFGPIGYEQEQHESEPGIWTPSGMVERNAFGAVLKRQRKWADSSEGTNDNLEVTNRISIVADDYVNEHWPAIKYVKWADTYWKVVSIDIERPRVILSLGGVWNGDKA